MQDVTVTTRTNRERKHVGACELRSIERIVIGREFLDAIKPSSGISAPDMTKDEMRKEVLIGKGLLSEDAV